MSKYRHLFGLLFSIGTVVLVIIYISKRLDTAEYNPASDSHEILAKLSNSGAFDFELSDLEGRSVKMSSFVNKVILLNLWATWCGPCVEEFPALLALARHIPEMRLVAVAADKEPDAVRSFVKAFGNISSNVTLLLDPEQKVRLLYGTQVLPESYIFAADSRLLRKVVGTEKWDRPEAIDFFRHVVADPSVR